MKKPLIMLWLLSVISTAAGIPYAFELQREVIVQVPFPPLVLALITLAQTALLLAVAIYLGWKLASNIGLEIFALHKTTGNTASKLKSIVKVGVPAGVVTGVVIYAFDYVFVNILNAGISVEINAPAVWKTLLASLYGGVVEEVLMRLFVLSLFAWLLAKLFRSQKPSENKLIIWSAIVAAAVLFGLGHLPVTAALVDITPLIVLRAIVLNGIGGLIFGWLYWKKGIEYSIMAHFTTDIVLLVILPTLTH